MALATAVPAVAQIDRREAADQARINQGVASGALRPGEANRAERHLGSIDNQEARMRARDGGRLTRYDRRVLNHRLNHESGRIYRLKHNARRY